MGEPELAGRTPSPRKKAREEKDSSLDRLNRKKAFTAVKGKHGVNDIAMPRPKSSSNDSDDDDASGERPRHETRAAKGGRSADDLADRADDVSDRPRRPPRAGAASQCTLRLAAWHPRARRWRARRPRARRR